MYGTCANCGQALYGTTSNTMTHLGVQVLAASWDCQDGSGNKAVAA